MHPQGGIVRRDARNRPGKLARRRACADRLRKGAALAEAGLHVPGHGKGVDPLHRPARQRGAVRHQGDAVAALRQALAQAEQGAGIALGSVGDDRQFHGVLSHGRVIAGEREMQAAASVRRWRP